MRVFMVPIVPVVLTVAGCAMAGPGPVAGPPGGCGPGNAAGCQGMPPAQEETTAAPDAHLQAAQQQVVAQQQTATFMAISNAVMNMAAGAGHPFYGQPSAAYWPGQAPNWHPQQPYAQQAYGQPPPPPPPQAALAQPRAQPACMPLTPNAHCPGL